MTNRDKFEEVFGYRPNEDAECVAPSIVCMARDEVCASPTAGDCPFWLWWDKEYKPCFILDMRGSENK